MKTIDSTAKRGFTRRSFIKGAATLTAAGLLTGCSANTEDLIEDSSSTVEAGKEEIYSGVCRGNCYGGCLLNVHVRDGQVVRTTAGDYPNPAYNRICTKGITQPARVYSADRLKYPMRRTGERGAGEFERISWDDAIDEIAERWQGYIDEYGSSSIAVFNASGNFGSLAAGATGSMVNRFRSVLGLSMISHDVDMAFVFGQMKAYGGLDIGNGANEITDVRNSKTIISWGANPVVSQPQIVHFFLEAKEQGAKLIVIDPVYNAWAAKADWYIPINSSTDGALALSILNEIITNGNEDEAFVREHTEAPLLIKESDGKLLRVSDLQGASAGIDGGAAGSDEFVVWDSEANGPVPLSAAVKPAYKDAPHEVGGITVRTVWEDMAAQAAKWPAESASKVCGVPSETIEELARIYVEDGPVNTYMSLGVDHYLNGQYNYWPMYSIGAVTGNIGKPGASHGPWCVSATNIVNPAMSKPVDNEGNPAQGLAASYNMNSVLRIVKEGKFGDKDAALKSIYVALANPASIWADHNKAIEFFKSIDFVVVAELAMTETATYADILLPVCHWFEMTDIIADCHSHDCVVLQEKAVEPQFESKSDFEIFKAIATRMGYGSFFDFTDEEYLTMALGSDKAKALGISFSKLKEEHALRFIPGSDYIVFEGGIFPSSTKRAVFYKESPAPAYNQGQTIDYSKERSLYWEPALEADVNSEARKKYPFHCISEHMRTRTHSQWFDVGYMKEFEAEPVVRINPDDAKEMGVAEGDIVRLFNDRGSVKMKATLSSGYPRKIVGCPRTFHQKEFIEGSFATLSTNQYNQACANQVFNDVAVAIEKV